MKRSSWRLVLILLLTGATIVMLFTHQWGWVVGLLLLWMVMPYGIIIRPLSRKEALLSSIIPLIILLIALLTKQRLLAAAMVLIIGLLINRWYYHYYTHRYVRPSKWIYTTATDLVYSVVIAVVGVLVLTQQATAINQLDCDDINGFLSEQSGWITKSLDTILSQANKQGIDIDNATLSSREQYQSISTTTCHSILARGQAQNQSGTTLIVLIALSVIIYPVIMINLWILAICNMFWWGLLARFLSIKREDQPITQQLMTTENHLQ